MKADELFLRLGKLTANAQAFELLTSLVFGACLGLDEDTAIRLSQRLHMRARLDFVAELARSRKTRLEPERVQEWLKTAEKALEARNRVTHTAWHGDPKTGEIRGVISKKAMLESRTADDLQQDHESLANAVQGAAALLGIEPFSTDDTKSGDGEGQTSTQGNK